LGAEAAPDAGDVVLDGLRGEEEPGRDLAVGQPLEDQRGDVVLPLGEHRRPGPPGPDGGGRTGCRLGGGGAGGGGGGGRRGGGGDGGPAGLQGAGAGEQRRRVGAVGGADGGLAGQSR